MTFLQEKYWIILLLNLFLNAAIVYTGFLEIGTIYLFIMVITVVFQVKATLKVNNPKLAVHKEQKGLMYLVISTLVLIVVGATIFVYSYINQWFSGLTGYAQFLYTWRFFLILVGTVLFLLAVVATVLKINAVNKQYFKKVGN
ncbi:hypothetical protein [Listeria monocytogenes]|uniref:hypothetical protein n=1 Tax=Listeria monocytogenes TaxID=1639 RepID=UPI000854AD86|nr:hypothetical protein [Listeria monocytogenes]EAD7602040.1 hypothetical protein [Listeria monocytogenes]OEP29542.1 hypothetical protein AF973_01625 [Listeria monocytogenes]OEP45155.1 hypothetical protein AJM35_00685 [Listeria monocytogenes]HAA0614838.1 hypothetical protein [Listeria monocytogenes]HAA6419269.1 hypothetical protein [Listeria monocytogenes]